MANKNRIILFRVTEKEYNFLCEQAKDEQTGKVNMSAYIRKCALQKSGYFKEEYLLKEVKTLSYQVRKIGVNINQAVKKINEGYYQAEESEKLNMGLIQLEEKFDQLIAAIRKAGKENGGNETDEY